MFVKCCFSEVMAIVYFLSSSVLLKVISTTPSKTSSSAFMNEIE